MSQNPVSSGRPGIPGASPEEPSSSPMPRRGRPLGCLLLIVVLLAGGGAASVHLYRQQQKTNGTPSASRKGSLPIPVTVGKVGRRTMPIELHAVGNVLPYSTVAITSQVTGQVMQVHFKQGDFVRRGQLLFTIDSRSQEASVQQVQATTFRDEAQIQQAHANLRKDEALLRQAEANLARDLAQQRFAVDQEKRYRALLGQGYVTVEQYQQLKANAEAYHGTIQADRAAIASARATLLADRSTVHSLEATLASDQATLRGAAVQVGYTTICSPLDGRTGSLTAYAGNVVRANDTTPLVTINQVTPIYVGFALPEHYLGQVRARQAEGPLRVQATMSGQSASPEPLTGVVTFFENAVDSATGTITLRATFPNKDRRLWPGRFVDVRVLLGRQEKAIVAPSQAVQAGQEGDYVFVLGADDRVEVRKIKVERTFEDWSVIASGLEPDETVVTDGQLQLVPGAKVQIRTGKPGRGRGAGGPEGASPGPRGEKGSPGAGAGSPATESGSPGAGAGSPATEGGSPGAGAGSPAPEAGSPPSGATGFPPTPSAPAARHAGRRERR